MADSKKAEKLAAARKMLKQYQKSKEISPSTSPRNNCAPSTVEGEKVGERERTGTTDSGGREVATGGGVRPGAGAETALVNGSQSNTVCSFFNHRVSEAGHNFFDSLQASGGKAQGDCDRAQAPLPLPLPRPPPPQPHLLFSPPDRPKEPPPPSQHPDLDSALLQEQNKNAQLQLHLREAGDRASRLEAEVRTTREECDARRIQETSSLEEKLKIQTRTIEILVSEKSELQQTVDVMHDEAKKKKSEWEEVMGRLSTSRGKVARLEKEVRDLGEARLQHSTMLRKLESSLSEATATAHKYKVDMEESEAEIKELKRRLDSSGQEVAALKTQLKTTEDQLSMAYIRLQQLGGSGGGTEGTTVKTEGNEEETAALRKTVEDVTKERDQMAHHYQQYIAQLDAQLQETNAKYEEVLSEREELKTREESLVGHIAEFERQLQKEASVEKRSSTGESSQATLAGQEEVNSQMRQELDITLQRIAELEASLETREAEVAEARVTAERYSEEVKELEKRLEASVPDAKLLQAAMESDKLAASRAIDQNNALKKQLDEMHRAFTTLSEGKLELMEELEKEQSMCGQLRRQLASYQHTTKEESTQLGQGVLVDGCSQTTYHDLENVEEQHPPVTVEAMILLEEKFRKTMDHLAQLSDEKQRLEHLVTQLQGETETIGEYIALYQAQRSLLERRAVEREQEVSSICKEKEALRNKLDSLSQIVPTLLPKGETKPAEGNEEIVEKVMSLIGEIGTSSLVQHHPNINFHPCPCCSGKLLTV